MNPNSNETPMQLPKPIEQAPNGERAVNDSETASSVGENSGSMSAAAMPTNIPLPTPPPMPVKSPVSSSTQDNPAQASDDSDLIEKEWVNKAKQIVEQTKDSPYQQSEELTVFKADYMKKRYNRAIKLK
jgi:hypothetical protein